MLLACVQDATSLNKLHDIVTPPPVPWWPPAPGWYLLGTVLLLVMLSALTLGVQHWHRNRYRSAALAELDRLRRAIQQSGKQKSVADLDRLLKRVALAAWPRERVAQLTGRDWISFLNQHSPSDDSGAFDADQTQVMTNAVYSNRISKALTADQIDDLFQTAQCWIRKHRVLSAEAEAKRHVRNRA